jgi:chromosome segregation ATPase
MIDVPETKEGIQTLQMAIKTRERIIEKQQSKIQALEKALATDQKTIRKVESLLSDRSTESPTFIQKEALLQSDCGRVEEKSAHETEHFDTTNRELAQQVDRLSQAKQRHASLTAKLQLAQGELDLVATREAQMVDRIRELANQKRQLEVSSAELLQYKAKTEALQAQLDVLRRQNGEFGLMNVSNRETIQSKSEELVMLRSERNDLQDKLQRAETENAKLARRVSRLQQKLSGCSGSLQTKDEQLSRSQVKLRTSRSNRAAIRELREKVRWMEAQLEQDRQKLAAAEAELHQSRITSPDMMEENERLKAALVELKERCRNLKRSRSTMMEEVASLKLTAGRLEEELECSEKLIVKLKNERDAVRAKLISVESFLDQCCSRMDQAEKESERLRRHTRAVNANQGEMEAVQLENQRLKTRLDTLETDLEAYTERQRRNRIRRRPFRV